MFKFIAVILLLATTTMGQYQANSTEASLVINGVDGPPYPTISVPLYMGNTVILEINAGANVPFTIYAAPNLTLTPLQTEIGSLDLRITDAGIQPFLSGSTDSMGYWTATLSIPENGVYSYEGTIPEAALQAIVMTPGQVPDWKLTAATSIVILENPITRTYLEFGEGVSGAWQTIPLGTTDLPTIPFYGAEQSFLAVNKYGMITFDQEMTVNVNPMKTLPLYFDLYPIIAGFWGMIDPWVLGETVDLIIDKSNPENINITVEWIRSYDLFVGIWSGGGGTHIFSVSIDEEGVITIRQDGSNQPSVNNWMIGIGSGHSFDPVGQHLTDLSAAIMNNYTSLEYEGVYEGFAGLNMIPIFPPFYGNLWDLAAYEWRYIPDFTGRHYTLTIVQ